MAVHVFSVDGKMAVHVKDLWKEDSSDKSSPIKKKMAVHVKDLCKEGGSSSLPIKKMAFHAKDLCKEDGSPSPLIKKCQSMPRIYVRKVAVQVLQLKNGSPCQVTM